MRLSPYRTHNALDNKREFSLIRKREKNKPTDRHFSLSPFFFSFSLAPSIWVFSLCNSTPFQLCVEGVKLPCHNVSTMLYNVASKVFFSLFSLAKEFPVHSHICGQSVDIFDRDTIVVFGFYVPPARRRLRRLGEDS